MDMEKPPRLSDYWRRRLTIARSPERRKFKSYKSFVLLRSASRHCTIASRQLLQFS